MESYSRVVKSEAGKPTLYMSESGWTKHPSDALLLNNIQRVPFDATGVETVRVTVVSTRKLPFSTGRS